jgi:tRNA G18 (ribose-2'-O)-methylase SpoU
VVFEPPVGWLGRNVHGPACGTRMTARPIDVVESIAARPTARGRDVPPSGDRLPFTVLVDNVRSLWNVGSIFRTADACGVERIVLCGITACPPRPEISKTALGADEMVSWEYEPDAGRALARLTARGFHAVALEDTPEAEPIAAFVWPAPLLLVLGNEVAGVGPGVRDACPRHVAIPMRGGKRSLNVAVAFGIAAHAAASVLERSAVLEP